MFKNMEKYNNEEYNVIVLVYSCAIVLHLKSFKNNVYRIIIFNTSFKTKLAENAEYSSLLLIRRVRKVNN